MSKTYTVILSFVQHDGPPSSDTMFMEAYAADSGQEAYERCVADAVGDRTVVDAIVIPGTHDDICVERGITSTTDPIKRVAEQARAQEARFQEEHDGMSSAEYYGESGFSDAQDAAMREREETE
jgi:hypothetical protein